MLRVIMAIALLLMSVSMLFEVDKEQRYETLLELMTCSVFVFVLFVASDFLTKSIWILLGLLLLILSSLLSIVLELDKSGDYLNVSHSSAMVGIDIVYITGLCLSAFGLHKIINYYITHSYYDELTGLCNRRKLNLFDDCKIEHILIYIDLDGLKSLNDNKGHEAGDKLIVTFASLLKSIPDIIECFRVGGDEFILICESEKEEGVIQCLKQKAAGDNVHFSFGSAAMKGGLKVALSEADQAMYLMKKKRK